MQRKPTSVHLRLIAAAALALAASSSAWADDNGMSRWTGDSYAFFNRMDSHPGGFNTARRPNAAGAVAERPRVEPIRTEQRIMLADVPALRAHGGAFRDDTGA